VAGAAALRRWCLFLASCDDDIRFRNNGDHADDDDGLSCLPCAEGPTSSGSTNRLDVFALSQDQGDPVASKKFAVRDHRRCPLQRSDESLHASHLNVVTTKRLARSLVHYLLIVVCLILAARVIKLGGKSKCRHSPRVSKMGLIVIDVFSDVKTLRTIVANKGVFQIPVFDDSPRFAADS